MDKTFAGESPKKVTKKEAHVRAALAIAHEYTSVALDNKEFKSSNSEQTYRAIHHWNQNDLLPNNGRIETGWKKYSIVDLFWLDVIEELRKFGYSIEQIRKVKDQVFSLVSKSGSRGNLIKYYIGEYLLEGIASDLIVDSEGQVRFVSANSKIEDLKGHCIRLSLEDVAARVFSKNRILTSQEASLLIDLHSGYKEIKIKIHNGMITQAILTKELPCNDLPNTLKRAVAEGLYQNIEIKHEAGKIVSLIVRTSKKYA